MINIRGNVSCGNIVRKMVLGLKRQQTAKYVNTEITLLFLEIDSFIKGNQ